MKEEWKQKVSRVAELRGSVDGKVVEKIDMEELKNEKVRGKEER